MILSFLTAIFGRIWLWCLGAGLLVLGFFKWKSDIIQEDRNVREAEQAIANAEAARRAVAASARVAGDADARRGVRERFTRKPDA